jgi:hypothetical protein
MLAEAKNMKKIKPILIFMFSFAFIGNIYAVDIYECTVKDSNDKTFQNKPCLSGYQQVIHKYDVSSKEPSDGLRSYEYVMLDRFHGMDMERLKSRLELEKEYRLAQQYYENTVAFEELRHQQAIEMFDKNYRHFWMYGYSNGGGDPLSNNFQGGFPTVPPPIITPPPISTPPPIPTPGPTVPGTP